MNNKRRYQLDKHRQMILDIMKDIYWQGINNEEVDWPETYKKVLKILKEYQNEKHRTNNKDKKNILHK